jgi:hypothetical protein
MLASRSAVTRVSVALARASLAAGSFGVACTAEVGPIEVARDCPSQPLRGPLADAHEPPERLIDDFETTDDKLEPVGGRDGAWVIGWDSTSPMPRGESSSQCSARGRQAGHFAGRGYRDWGANWTAVLRQVANGIANGYDASEYSGISFWAALGGTEQASLTMPVGLTTLDVAWNGGVCLRCMDYYRTEVVLSPRWERHEVRFDELFQLGIGDPLVPLRRDQLVGFIIWPPNEGFDIWIDDVRFMP